MRLRPPGGYEIPFARRSHFTDMAVAFGASVGVCIRADSGEPIPCSRACAFRPDLQDCLLEDRLSPVVSNLGVIVLTTGGFYLLIPFPGPFAGTEHDLQ